MKFALILLTILVILAILFFSGLAAFVVYPKRHTLESCRDEEERHGVFGDFDSLTSVSYLINSHDGYALHAEFFAAPETSNHYVIISHGYTATRCASVKYLHQFRRLGYNCIIYDDRGHGENIRTKCTLGLYESEDLMAVIDDTYSRYGRDIYLGLHGESMGSAISLSALRYKPRVAFVVADCGFANLYDLLKGGYERLHLGWLIGPVNAVTQARYGFDLRDTSPVDALAGNKVPLCIIHGADDGIITPDNADRLAEATAGNVEVHKVDGAGHAESREVLGREAYEQVIADFLANVGLA